MRSYGTRKLKDVMALKRSAAMSLWKTHHDPPPQGGGQFLSILSWVKHWLRVAGTPRRKLKTYEHGTGIFEIPDRVTIALAADWGTGTRSAYEVADGIREREPNVDVTIHMGDVYYSGTGREYDDWFLGERDWPRGALYTFAMNANHEMYSGGHGYFDTALPALKQETSYFCLENSHWRILSLDSGYHSAVLPLIEKLWRPKIRIDEAILQWLRSTVFANKDQRPVIMLTHHQLFSAFEGGYSTLGKNLAPYLDRVLLWLWGHEHRFAGYGPVSVNGLPTVRARCIGHGGMPIEIRKGPSASGIQDTNLVFYDNRMDPQSSAELDKDIGYCGCAIMRLVGPVLSIEYVDQKGSVLLHESWDRSAGVPVGSVTAGSQKLYVVHPDGLDGLVHPRRVAAPVP